MKKVELPLSDRQLLEECEVTIMACPIKSYERQGSVVLLRHLPTGIVTTSKQENDEYLNQIVCLKKLRLEARRQAVNS